MKRTLPAIVAILLGHGALAAAQGPVDLDTRDAVPGAQAGKLPRTNERYRALQQEIERARPAVESAKQKSEALSVQATALRQQLIETAARVQALEQQKAQIDGRIVALSQQERTMTAAFEQDRARVSHLLAVLERLQTDLPPALALEPADALKASRGSMVLGAWLPRIYAAAAQLSARVKALKRTRAALQLKRKESIATASKLNAARNSLDKLLASKEQEASGATAAWQRLQSRFDSIAAEASDLKALLDRVSALRARATPEAMVVVSAGRGAQGNLKPGMLTKPVVGQALTAAAGNDIRMPGLDFLTAPGASVVAPADCQVLFAGPYHKSGQVLILQAAGGYDLVLAGLDRVDVRPGDRLLAGEPVGRMPGNRTEARLYFELRRNGKGVSPLPWLGLDLRKKRT